MSAGNADADEAVLCMVQRYGVLMMEDIISQADFSWAQLFLAIDRLSRKNLIVLHRVGLSYQMFLMNQAVLHGQDHHREEPAVAHR